MAHDSWDVDKGMRLDIWSDVICPWCFLGKRRLEAALAELPFGSDIEVRWRAFQLDPHAPEQPGDLRATLERKYGPGAYDAMIRRLSTLGADAGITYRFDIAQRVNTRRAHELLAWAADISADDQDRLAERLFAAYFEEGANVADHTTLRKAAVDVGLDEARATEVLATGEFAGEVEADIRSAAEHQLTGVPAFVMGDALLISGAQEVDTMVATLTRAHERFGV